MVNNHMKCLDEGEIKNLCYTIPMDSNTPIWQLCIDKSTRVVEEKVWCDETDSLNTIMVHNDNYKEPQGILKQAIRNAASLVDCCTPDVITAQWNRNLKQFKLSVDDVHGYLDIIPFTPSIMLNISPNWKSQYNIIPDDIEPCEREYLELENLRMVEALCELVESYMAECNRFDYYDYIVECGGEGDFLHAHCVAHVNPKIVRSVCGDSKTGSSRSSHIGRGNHVQQLLKISKGIKGIKGKITRHGIQCSVLRKQYLVDDKLAYLHEDKKPVGHQNLYAIWDAPKHVVLGGV